jgi:hypothetical protein
MRTFLIIIVLILSKQFLYSQDVRIYHGDGSQSVFLKQHEKLENSSKESVRIIRAVNGIVTIHILNPNPFFYNYEIKTEDVDIKDDYSDQFAELVKLINALPDFASSAASPFAARVGGMGGLRPLAAPGATKFDEYQTAIQGLNTDLTSAKTFVETSDQPETPDEALRRVGNNAGLGFRAAIAKIQGLPSNKYHFNSLTLEKDLTDLLDASVADSSFETDLNIAGNASLIALYKSAFKGLNSQLVKTVKDILSVTGKDRIIRFNIPVKENKQTTIKLIVTKIDKDKAVVRDLLNEEVATVFPLYVRKRFEVVPVVNLVFQSGRQKFTLENDVVRSTTDDDAKFNVGAMALMNFASFGEFKEYGVGFGLGYSMQPGGKASSFFALPSLSYKDIFRIGFGFGFNLAPIGLKNGAKVDMPLPDNISNLEDVLDYKRKPAAVLSISISGLKL